MIIRGAPEPPWQQLTAILRDRIESGDLKPRQQLPSALKLSETYEVAVPTVRKALNQLKAEGLTTAVPGYGTFVSDAAVRLLTQRKRSRRPEPK